MIRFCIDRGPSFRPPGLHFGGLGAPFWSPRDTFGTLFASWGGHGKPGPHLLTLFPDFGRPVASLGRPREARTAASHQNSIPKGAQRLPKDIQKDVGGALKHKKEDLQQI